jgi:hypothetical protein
MNIPVITSRALSLHLSLFIAIYNLLLLKTWWWLGRLATLESDKKQFTQSGLFYFWDETFLPFDL